MNNLAKFTIGIFLTLGIAWLAFVVGAREQYGDLVPSPQALDEDGSFPKMQIYFLLILLVWQSRVPRNTPLLVA